MASEVLKIIADGLHAELLKLSEIHFAAEGLLLFGQDGERVGTIAWPKAGTRILNALTTSAKLEAANVDA